jgi:hypothetical protein
MLQPAKSSSVEGVTVATTILIGSGSAPTEWANDNLEPTSPGLLGPGWRLLGYDIADPWLTSGLMNCGYTDAEREPWMSRWRQKLNAHHLFDTPDEGLLFAQDTNERVFEHAPFYVYGLYTSETAVRLP